MQASLARTRHEHVVASGEIVLDRIIDHVSDRRCCRLGGTPANVARAVVLTGGRAKLVGVVGDDPEVLSALKTLAASGVDVRSVQVQRHYSTPVVECTRHSDRRDDCVLRAGDRLHFALSEFPAPAVVLDDTAAALLFSPHAAHAVSVRTWTEEALEIARRRRLWRVVDLGTARHPWKSDIDAQSAVEFSVNRANIVKASLADLRVVGVSAAALRRRLARDAMLWITEGEWGSTGYWRQLTVSIKPSRVVKDGLPFGWGDAFLGGVLRYLVSHGVRDGDAIRQELMLSCGRAASEAAIRTCTAHLQH